ncbi:diguanylate cyclase [Paenibacillus sp. PL2-23]|uniref:diguanylate cyclase domain-containing protein n=1 Tax=Paenibacillus sp. PL2-23 TaxID=2100729 RepID=UPI0030FCA41C
MGAVKRRHAGGLLSDSGFLLFVVLCFAGILFVSSDQAYFLQNIVLLNAAFMIAILAYFINITTGLILNMLFLFGYGTYMLYRIIAIGDTVESEAYFWLIMPPLYTAAIWLFSLGTRRLQRDNEALQQANSRLATMDQETHLRTAMIFQKDAAVFMALSTRYQIPLTLLVMQVRYWNEVRRLMSSEQLTEVLSDLSELSQTSIRDNDALYMLDNDQATWGLLLFTNAEGAAVVAERIKSNVAAFNRREESSPYIAELQLRIGQYTYDSETVVSSFDWIEKASKQLEYDV